MAVSYRSSTYGLLYYEPATHHNVDERPQKLFRPRRVGPGRVCIKSVGPDLESTKNDRPQVPYPFKERRKPSVHVKLAAVTRENAKRFLRSVIASPNSNSDSTKLPSTDKADKRRSWSPTKRSQSVQSGDSGAAAGNNMRGNIRHSIGGPINAHLARPRLQSDARDRSAFPSQSTLSSTGARSSPRIDTSTVDSVIPNLNLNDEKPIASGNGVSLGVHLAEPVLFLQGFENAEHATGNTAMLRGSLHLRVQKSAKIKAVNLKFKGTAVTKWPEGIPPRKVEFEERDTIMSHTWPFFNAQFESAEKGTNADHVQLFKDGASATVTRLDPLGRSNDAGSNLNLSAKEAKKLALSVNQSRSFGKGDPVPGGPTVAAKGYRTFMPGDYIYNFELPLDSRLPETIDVELGSVKYELEATVERSGAFRANLIGNKEVTLIRAPAEGSLEQVEPIAISRNWEDLLHYDIVISGKSFPLGSSVPIAFKLTPLAKVQCHRIKVLVTENIEYFCSNKRVHRMEPTRKVQLFEKRADGPPNSTYPGSTMRVTAGGGIPYDQRARAARGEDVASTDSTNLLGNLEGDSNIGPTEMEFNVQLPSCHTMKDRERNQKLHFDTTYQNIQVHHWIKIVMRLSRPDAQDPSKRRHFEISIDSPFHILSCRATQANISLPAYSSPMATPMSAHLFECGCPGAAQRRNSPTGLIPAMHAINTGSRTNVQDARPAHTDPWLPQLQRPPTLHHADHVRHDQHTLSRLQRAPDRPMHLLRAPSFNPPAFEDEEPPPPLITPPPQYDSIASPTSGLADYFARLGDAYDSDSGDESHTTGGRVNVPLTPGGRVNRSMDLGRGWVPVGGRS
ncbi:Putative arrestin-related trafficking adapter [Fulvia fulva]|uniref:Arrestin-related trafficking adapter n=1 Tax=Passalora fulva TaxID=5499 RepID=A0A9Q8P4T7_PASFU|nr:Putative arrestin-related trafficking adapter [Fulvia fulva]UJO13425.1 Putative arrestin-related trafficking adapter [Fulvia fulva]